MNDIQEEQIAIIMAYLHDNKFTEADVRNAVTAWWTVKEGKRNIRRVVCAAIRADDGCLLLGVRHYDAGMNAQMVQRRDAEKFYHKEGADQGFVDQHGVYMTRTEAFKVAQEAGQIIDIKACGNGRLYSEGLY